MRCKACNVVLSDYEATRKTSEDTFLDLCNTCYRSIKDDVSCINNNDTDILTEYSINSIDL